MPRARRPRRMATPCLGLAGALLCLQLCGGGARAAGTRVCDGYAGCSAGLYTTHGYQRRSETSYWEMSAGDECTNYAAFVESHVYHVRTPGYILGDGGEWAASAAQHGVTVNHTPTVGAVAEWDAGDAGIGGYGHVGIVERVGPGGGSIDVSQQHIGTDVDGYDWERIRAHGASGSWEPWPDHFIHFAGATPIAPFRSLATRIDRLLGLPRARF